MKEYQIKIYERSVIVCSENKRFASDDEAINFGKQLFAEHPSAWNLVIGTDYGYASVFRMCR